MFVRNTGKLCFATLADGDETELRAILGPSTVGAGALSAWKTDADIDHPVFVVAHTRS